MNIKHMQKVTDGNTLLTLMDFAEDSIKSAQESLALYQQKHKSTIAGNTLQVALGRVTQALHRMEQAKKIVTFCKQELEK
jgi:hypothetical protein